MTVLFFCSILMGATLLERIWFYRGAGYVSDRLWRAVREALDTKNPAQAQQAAMRYSGMFAKALAEVLQLAQTDATRDQLEDLWLLRREEAAEALRQQLAVFATLSFITPLIGLMGSVLGIHHSFHSIALSGVGGPSVIAAGVSEALLCTLVGVTVAVPSLVLNNIFSSAMIARLSGWDRAGQDMLRILESSSAKAGKSR